MGLKDLTDTQVQVLRSLASAYRDHVDACEHRESEVARQLRQKRAESLAAVGVIAREAKGMGLRLEDLSSAMGTKNRGTIYSVLNAKPPEWFEGIGEMKLDEPIVRVVEEVEEAW